MRTIDLLRFIQARHAVYTRRAAGEPAPWTMDPILQAYRFCNVYRELDAVTVWIRDHWREPLARRGDPDLWFWMLVARFVNWPPTLRLISFLPNQGRWAELSFVDALDERAATGEKVWGGAYMVRCDAGFASKAEGLAKSTLTPAWRDRKNLRPRKGELLEEYAARLCALRNVQGFIAGQVIADAKYADPTLMQADDWFTYASSGPGSRRGLNRILGRALEATWDETAWHMRLLALQREVNAQLPARFARLHAQDVQNCLCEFDKYERARLGEGRPKTRYNGR